MKGEDLRRERKGPPPHLMSHSRCLPITPITQRNQVAVPTRTTTQLIAATMPTSFSCAPAVVPPPAAIAGVMHNRTKSTGEEENSVVPMREDRGGKDGNNTSGVILGLGNFTNNPRLPFGRLDINKKAGTGGPPGNAGGGGRKSKPSAVSSHDDFGFVQKLLHVEIFRSIFTWRGNLCRIQNAC